MGLRIKALYNRQEAEKIYPKNGSLDVDFPQKNVKFADAVHRLENCSSFQHSYKTSKNEQNRTYATSDR